VPSTVSAVEGGGGNDTIVATSSLQSCPAPCRLGVGSQTFEGGPGDDVVFGERGNDTLRGGEGDDRLYGGIGDDLVFGGPGNDQLAGGHGADTLDGEAGDDYVRGDGTIDRIRDTGGGFDTLSYATGVTPGFGGSMSAFPGFPAAGGERGVHVDLKREFAPGDRPLNGDNGVAQFGGGVDEVQRGAFERIVGTAFADYIVGSDASEQIYGGGGADVLLGEGGSDTLVGGAGGDDCEDAEVVEECEGSSGAVAQRDTESISVGFMVPSGVMPRSELYLVGSVNADDVTATYVAGTPSRVTFTSTTGAFDDSAADAGGCAAPTGTGTEQLVCTVPAGAALESLVMAGMGGGDELRANGFPTTTSVMILGGSGGDDLTGGGATEDVLVDGDGTEADADTLTALGGDDALLHNGGPDTRSGGDGNDLFLSSSLCDGGLLDGEGGRDNASWTRLTSGSVQANLEQGLAGRPSGGPTPVCSSGSPDHLTEIEDLEGKGEAADEAGDVLYGDAGDNQLLGWEGPDSYFAAGGNDTILANSGDDDAAIDCGPGERDRALIDQPPFSDPPPVECELVNEAPVNSFRFESEFPPVPPPETQEEAPPPTPAPGSRPTPPRPDRTAPGTSIRRHPPKLVRSRKARRVAFAFRSNEAGARFRCRIDRRPFRACASPRAFRVGRGRHTFAVFAIDAAGNRDASPARFRFRMRLLGRR
jgi:Ca2+-binding RTX toxin-like protein